MGVFGGKIFNEAVFSKYLERIIDVRKTEIGKSGAIKKLPESLVRALPEQTGGNKITRVYKGLANGSTVNYDGATNITTNELGTYSQDIIVVGRAKGYDELDFADDMTGENWVNEILDQVGVDWNNLHEDQYLSILKGIFGSALAGNIADTGAVVGASTLNTAIRNILGDNASRVRFAFMHSQVAKELENLNLLEYLKYTDANGIQRPSELAAWNGKIVFVTDKVPAVYTAPVYALTTDVAIDPDKTYYTKSGDVYTPVASPDVQDIATYYEMTAKGYTTYTTYVLGEGAIEVGACPVKVPVEIAREATAKGGKTLLITRERRAVAPAGVSFVGSISSKSPTDNELETAANWALVKDGSNNPISNKACPFVAIKTVSNLA